MSTTFIQKGNKPRSGETAIKALDCKALDGTLEYAILISGCGDGNIIPRTKGFTTAGKEVLSPPFRAFRLQGSVAVYFSCTFTSCQDASGCDGDTNSTFSKIGICGHKEINLYETPWVCLHPSTEARSSYEQIHLF